MVVGVKECEWLLLEHKENSVEELEVFRQIVDIVENEELLRPSSGAANAIVKAVSPEPRNQLLPEEQ